MHAVLRKLAQQYRPITNDLYKMQFVTKHRQNFGFDTTDVPCNLHVVVAPVFISLPVANMDFLLIQSRRILRKQSPSMCAHFRCTSHFCQIDSVRTNE